MAHDLGQSLGCGAHVAELRRTASGEFEIAQARTMEELQSLAADDRLIDVLVPTAQMMPGFPSVVVDDVAVSQIRNGRNFAASPFRAQPASRHVKAVSRQGELVAIGEAVLPNVYHPLVVL
jgi:tRNA pseudouridine55 synthase